MSEGLRDVYRQRVLEHSKHPRNRGRLAAANREALGFNPLCGDKLTVYLEERDGVIHDIAFDGTGCAISVASASMMTTALRGHSVAEARSAIAEIDAMLSSATLPSLSFLQDLSALENVRAYPSRVKCATLAWRTLEGALDQATQSITTE
ncbi:MAG: SUF system NifU family Fe-S cluster assembly protein [Gammaproteobacteria bacterium]|jgi:nitrogen fixation NifU-like protein|nr:SUF system NifU family Fe-S cluster assembly protein [Gammaproteobacteria bacterium]